MFSLTVNTTACASNRTSAGNPAITRQVGKATNGHPYVVITTDISIHSDASKTFAFSALSLEFY